MKQEQMISSINLELNNAFLTLINFSAELNISTYENGAIIYYVNIRNSDYDHPITGDKFEDIKEATKYLEETCRKYVTNILKTRIQDGEWAKKRLDDMNEYGIF
jgi:hypothetical protein